MTPPVIYSVDTSALLDGLERYYPEATFPALWVRVDELIDAGRFLLSEEVWRKRGYTTRRRKPGATPVVRPRWSCRPTPR